MPAIVKKTVAWIKAVLGGFSDGHCSLHAAGLTYFSMLALIPVLCCVLAVAKVAHVDAFARAQINAQIDALIANVERGPTARAAYPEQETPEEARAREKKRIAAEEFARQARTFSDQTFAQIENFDVGRLGLIGLCMLLWTVISSLGHVEVSLNEIWGVPKARPIWQKAGLYLFVAVVLPVFGALAMSLPILNVAKNVIVATMGATALTKWASDGLVWFIDSFACRNLVSLGFSSLAFGYLLWVLPNCRVRFRFAWCGGLLTAILFTAVLKVCAVVQVGIAKSSAVYGSFAFLPIVLAWFYMSWQVILLGACMVKAFDAVSKGEK